MNQNLAFLILMICVEALLNPSEKDELTHRVSRRAAILLGRDYDERDSIFSKMKGYYTKRSQLVHSGNSDIATDDLDKLRLYSRDLIKKLYHIGKEKDEIGRRLDRVGFNDDPYPS